MTWQCWNGPFLIFLSAYWSITLTCYNWNGRLFQAERPVWYTIHCNVLPKDDKETKVAEEFKKNQRIVTVTDGKDPSNDDLSWLTNTYRLKIFVLNKTYIMCNFMALMSFTFQLDRWRILRIHIPFEICNCLFVEHHFEKKFKTVELYRKW